MLERKLENPQETNLRQLPANDSVFLNIIIQNTSSKTIWIEACSLDKKNIFTK